MQREASPEWQQFTERLISAIKELSLLYANTPNDKTEASLQDYVNKIMPELTEAIGADLAAKTLEVFALAVMSRKHEIEAGGGGASRA
jgi:hypothetical protein